MGYRPGQGDYQSQSRIRRAWSRAGAMLTSLAVDLVRGAPANLEVRVAAAR